MNSCWTIDWKQNLPFLQLCINAIPGPSIFILPFSGDGKLNQARLIHALVAGPQDGPVLRGTSIAALPALTKIKGGSTMKKVTKVFGILFFSAFLGFSSPVVAQTTDNTTTTTTTDDMDDDNDDDMGKWGLAGLAGLLGLLGLRRRDDDRNRTTTTTRRD